MLDPVDHASLNIDFKGEINKLYTYFLIRNLSYTKSINNVCITISILEERIYINCGLINELFTVNCFIKDGITMHNTANKVIAKLEELIDG